MCDGLAIGERCDVKRAGNIFFLLFAALCFFGAARMNTPLRDLRKVEHISQGDPVDNAPPMVAFTTVALGGFRGIIADILWVRASDLQEKGKYFELVQLADWITKLEPRYAQVWSFHGWNLAYNVSVLFNAPADRWRWVRRGIELLRDEGLLYNPGDPDVLYQLGWIFQHKIGQDMDEAHKFYKESWAREMMRLFAGPAPDYAAMSSAPKSRDELFARPGARVLVLKIEAAGFDPYAFALLGTNVPKTVAQLIATDPAASDLKAYIRRHEMVNVYKLDPAIMKDVDDAYGPLDWRMSQAHSIYWAWQSRKFAGKTFAQTQADRMMFQSMVEAFRQGRLFVSPTTGQLMPTPNLDLTPRVRKKYEEAIASEPGNETFKTAHKNFLRESIETLYTFHRVKEAQELLDDLRTRYPDDENAHDLEYFVFAKLGEGVGASIKSATSSEAMRLIEAHFYQAEIWRMLGDDDRAAGMAARAMAYYKGFRDSHTDPEWWGRVGIPDPAEIRKSARDRAEQDFAAMQKK